MKPTTDELIAQVTETRRQVLLAADTLHQATEHLVNLTRELQSQIEIRQGDERDRTA